MSNYRLGLDLGTNSIGWCAVTLDATNQPSGVLDAGVRILSPNEEAGRDPQSKASLAANRRAARSMRRRRDRFLRRQRKLMETLAEEGLMPRESSERKALEGLDPYELRAKALDEALPAHHLGRAIFHLNQRRGFKSNRIADSDDAEGSAMKAGMAALAAALKAQGARTLGEFLAARHRKREPVRFRPTAQGAKNLYDFYPTRAMVEAELDTIWEAQRPHHPTLSPQLLDKLKRIVIAQRPLKKPLVGRCTFRPDEERAPRALPLFQRFRILVETAALEIERPGRKARKLTLQERTALASLLSTQASTVTFEKMHRALKLPDDARFNLERGGRKGLQPDMTAAVLAKGGDKQSFGKTWRSLPGERQAVIVEKLLSEENEDTLLDWLQEECGLSDAAAEHASKARLPQGHGHIGRSMLADLVDVMESESVEDGVNPDTGEIYACPLTYDAVVAHLGLHHSNLSPEGQHARLPYYGEAMARHVISNPAAPEGSQERIGRVPNPTVHIALNQVRAVVNALIDAYGPPQQIVLELARELKQNREQKDKATRENRENEQANERRRAELEAIGLPDTHGNRLLLRLYEELPADERVCVYSGAPISREMLFDGSVDIDHILPRSKTLDDGFANKVLCTREANRRKGNRAPADAWSGDDLLEIAERAERLFKYKAWRFAPDAMERFEKDRDFIARHLTDSQHMARLAKDYLGQLFGNEANSRVWATPGRLTAMLRAKWGLNALFADHNRVGDDDAPAVKNRDDHRHHAVDAFVVACTDRGVLQRVATAAGRAEDHDLDRWAQKGEFPEPFEGYREALRDRLETLIVSHKPDHGPEGKLHEETAYGLVDDQIDGKRFNLVTRKPVTALTEREIGQVRDAALRERLEEVAFEAKRNGEKLPDALARFAQEAGVRRVRILKTERSVVTINHGGGKFQKAYVPGSNHRIEIFETSDGKWLGEGVTTYDANRPGYQTRWKSEYPGARLVMKLHRGDLIEADRGDGAKVYKIYSLWIEQGTIPMALHFETGKLNERHRDKQDRFSWWYASYTSLKNASARRVRVNAIGRVTPVRDSA